MRNEMPHRNSVEVLHRDKSVTVLPMSLIKNFSATHRSIRCPAPSTPLPFHRRRVFRWCGNARWYDPMGESVSGFAAHVRLRQEASQRRQAAASCRRAWQTSIVCSIPSQRWLAQPSRSTPGKLLLRRMAELTSHKELGTCWGVAVTMVPGARIELATPAFSGRRSTNELPRQIRTFQF
jgi:hypothetical protein